MEGRLVSATYSIACRECRKKLWIAQGHGGGEFSSLYYGEPKTMEALKTFLYAHQGHHLVFDECLGDNIGEYDDVTPK